MRRATGVWLVALLAGASSALPAWAETVDGNKPLLCALVDISSCSPKAGGVDCEKQTPEGANVPRFLRIDVADKSISGIRPDGEQKRAQIATVQRLQDHLLLQGVDEGPLNWSMAILESTGQMALTGSKTDTSFVVFGACTEP